jgi:nucleoside-diphosphate-sugar epimerase
MKTALVLGGGGFIGSHLVKKLKEEGFWVRAVDLKHPEHWKTFADDFIIGDLRDPKVVANVMLLESNNGEYPLEYSHNSPRPFVQNMQWDEVYQLAADMGGAGYIFTGNNDADVMHNSAVINLNVAKEAIAQKVKKVFYSSSACMYPEHNQLDPENPNCEESSAYPANPDSEYGWEKLFSERLFLAFNRNYGLDVRIARFHNIFGPYGTYKGGKEKSPAAMCRKAAETLDGGSIEVWGDGLQTRSFLYIDECVEAVLRFMRQDSFLGPVNIGSEEMVTINQLAQMAIDASGKNIAIENIGGEEFKTKYGFKCPTGVRGRNSDNKLYKEKMGWESTKPLHDGILATFNWINKQVNN